MSMYKAVVLLTTLFVNCSLITASPRKEVCTLQLVHVLFRHGHRTNDPAAIYPNDPHKNETYYPYGIAELTNEGRKLEYNLGKALRQRYDKFLGPIYTPDILEATSSSYNRTKSSLQLVLAGLFPPIEDLVFEPGLNWQPIPYYYEARERDKIFFGVDCPNFKKLYNKYVNSPRVTKENEQNKEVFDYLSKNSGWNITSYEKTFFLYVGLEVEQALGLSLPEWTKNVFPKPLQDFAIKSYELLTGTTELRKLSIGHLLKKIIDDSKAKSRDELIPENRKIFLYSGHELNLASMLITLDIFKPHIPPYGSYIIFELHRINKVDGIKIFYQDYSEQDPHILRLPACEEFCPLHKFILLLEEYLPDDGSCGR